MPTTVTAVDTNGRNANPIWCVIVAMTNPELTEAALSDLLAQSVPTRVLLVLQGVDPGFRDRFLQIAEQESRLLVWSHDLALPSLSATWNRALQFVWGCGGTEALVCNNDVRLDVRTVNILQAVLTWPKTGNLFVSAVGVTKEQYESRPDPLFSLPDGDLTIPEYDQIYASLSKGGPDFSCYLISREGHEKYPFDERLIPSHCEDLDLHRRMMLGGDGERIFSINLPYWHIGGGANTLKSLPPEQRARLESKIGQAREYYARKWNGPVNGERLTIPFDMSTDQDGVTTPDLQRAGQKVDHVPAH